VGRANGSWLSPVDLLEGMSVYELRGARWPRSLRRTSRPTQKTFGGTPAAATETVAPRDLTATVQLPPPSTMGKIGPLIASVMSP
jgi:hypothetical protein